jgi:hypothetical protein
MKNSAILELLFAERLVDGQKDTGALSEFSLRKRQEQQWDT